MTGRRKIFVIQSLDRSSRGVYELIRSAAAFAQADVERADELEGPGSSAQNIYSAISTASLVVADLTSGGPNVMYEVGIAHAQNRPCLLIANSGRDIPFDLAHLRVLIYETTFPNRFVQRLAAAITQALNDPESYAISRVISDAQKTPGLFISYSHSDREYLDRLLIHLKPLEREGLIDLWVDTRLRAGDKWKKEIQRALDKANVAIILISADFLASDFITDNELPPLLRNAEEKGTRILPLIVKPCRFVRDKNLRHFQAVNDPKHSLALLPEGQQEVFYDRVAAEVEKWLQRN